MQYGRLAPSCSSHQLWYGHLSSGRSIASFSGSL